MTRPLSAYQIETLRFMADGRLCWNALLSSNGIGDSTTLRSLWRRALIDETSDGRFVINARGLRARFPVVK